MTTIHLNGFDTFGSQADVRNVYASANPTYLATGGRYGGVGLQIYEGYAPIHGNTGIAKIIPTALNEAYVGVGLKFVSEGNENAVVSFGPSPTASNSELQVSINSSLYRLDVYRGNRQFGGTLVGSTPNGILTVGGWHWLEVCYIDSTTDGLVQVWLDDVLQFTMAGNTSGSGTPGFACVNIGEPNYSYVPNGNFGMIIDDIYINDNTGPSPQNGRLGDCRIGEILVNRDAGPNQGTPFVAGPHYAMVDTPQGYPTTNYISILNSYGQTENFGVSQIPIIPVDVFAVSVITQQQKTDAGIATAHIEARSSGVHAAATSFPVLTSVTVENSIFTKDPNTTNDWTPASLANMTLAYVVDSA